MKDFLFEIGVEEIPAGFISEAMQKIGIFFKEQIENSKLSYHEIREFSTPRRFAVLVTRLAEAQKDEVIEKTGPSKKIAYDENGNLTKAALGFLNGTSPEKIYLKETPKGEYLAYKVEVKGKPTAEILPGIMTECLAKLSFPKTMRWGDKKIAFARPIRWLLALFGDEILPFNYEGIVAGNVSYGIRFENLLNKITVTSPTLYEEALESVKVIADREKRKESIVNQLKKLFRDEERQVVEDRALLDIVTDITEYPTAVTASFEDKYLQLPAKIITSTLTQNQKYFAVRKANGELSADFVFISNGDPACGDIIKKGNEKVVRARLEDAEFYYREDLKKPLSAYVSKLKEVLFQAQLGTLFEKTVRIEKLTEYLAKTLNFTATETNASLQAAHLCKADLVTNMLGEKEFTKLQGYIGMKYALACQEQQDVALAIYEHYQPRGQNDALPTHKIGAVCAIADKLDTVCGIIGIGQIPTGSADPFALRRAANGIVQIIEARNFVLDIDGLIEKAYTLLAEKLPSPTHNMEVVRNFMRQRVDWLLQQNGIEYDVIQSVTHLAANNLIDIKKRAVDLQNYKKQEAFVRLVLSFKRISNIIAGALPQGEINTVLLQLQAEQILYENYLILQEKVKKLLAIKDYHAVMEALVAYSPFIDKFFNEVLVNTPEVDLKNNRYLLLANIRKLFLEVADLNLIVVES